MEKEQLFLLAEKYLNKTATDAEQQQLHQWYDSWQDDEEQVLVSDDQTFDIVKERILARIMLEINGKTNATVPVVHRIHFLKTSWFKYAVAVIFLIGSVAVWYQLSKRRPSVPQMEIVPGTNKAILTIAGKTIDLSSDKTGIAVGKTVTYNDGEKIIDAGQQMVLNTPRGGQYQATLPDGSKVWLNAASSIKFPSKFTGNNREVTITGEVYLEIVKNKKQPFFVHTNKATIQVLGTSFNINTYEDEGTVKTTLIEGSVKLSKIPLGKEGRNDLKESSVVLKPGQQAEIPLGSEGDIQVQEADLSSVSAWKDGMFRFKRMSIQSIMRQLARWYDLEVVYKGEVNERFISTIPRNVPISQVLEVLELTKAVHFEISGKKVTVIGK